MSDNGQIVWEDPPQPAVNRSGRGKWIPVLEPLMEHPQRWARIYVSDTREKARQTAGNLRNTLKIPPGRWEFISRQLQGEERHGVYARYLGPKDGAS